MAAMRLSSPGNVAISMDPGAIATSCFPRKHDTRRMGGRLPALDPSAGGVARRAVRLAH
jgi:hypothetical protein